MDLIIDCRRTVFTPRSTISMVSIEGVFQCYVLEDTVREIPDVPIERWKIDHETAIPAGKYEVVRTRSNRFSALAGHDVILPLLVGVNGYQGVRIHPGNIPENTDGCLLPGLHKGQDEVTESRVAFAALDAKISEALADGDRVWIDVHGVPE